MRREDQVTKHNIKRYAAGFAAFFCWASPILAEDVRLTSRDGGFELAGRALSFDGTYLQIASQHGPVSVVYENTICEGEGCPEEGNFVPTVRLTSVPAIAEVLLPALIQRFATIEGYRSRTEQVDGGGLVLVLEDGASEIARFEVRPAGADEGFADLIAFESDIILSRRAITEAETEMAEDARVAAFGAVGQSRVIGYDALIPVVSPTRGVRSISLMQLVRSLDGELADWEELGSTAGPLRLQVVDGELGSDAPTGADVTRHPDFDTTVAAVVADANALGIVSFQKSGFAQQVDLVDSCGFVASPDLTAVKTGDYPLAVPLFLYHASRRLPDVVDAFLAWLPSPQAQLVVRRSGFVDAGLLPIPLDAQGQRFVSALQSAEGADALRDLQELTQSLMGRTRLSMSFRFLPGGTELDPASRAQLLRLVQAVDDGDFSGRSILLVGFSDGQGVPERNKALSERRANAVRERLVQVLPLNSASDVVIETAGFGEALPVGCDDTAWGRRQNRRVELWVSD